MKREIWLWQLCGFAFTSLGGTFLHFLYDLTNQSLWVAPFSGVNESTWEHMKLLFWPMFIFTLVQNFFFKAYKNFMCVKLRGILLGLALIPVIYYTYNGVIGKSADWMNVAIFFISAGIAYVYEAIQLKRGTATCKSAGAAFALLSVIAFLFVIFTFKTPGLNVFKDPLTNTYGII